MKLTEEEVRIIKKANKEKLGLSIITNWGCPFSCHYCIWKQLNYNISDVFGDLDKLDDILGLYHGKKINLSGGGDPLYNYMRFFISKVLLRTFKIAKNNNKKVDIHTRIILPARDLQTDIEKVIDTYVHKWVISFDDIESIEKIDWCNYKNKKVRLVYIIKPSDTLDKLKEMIKIVKALGFQLTFKELVYINKTLDKKYYDFLQEAKQELTEKGKIEVLFNNDYNIYYFPDSTLREKYTSAKKQRGKNKWNFGKR